MFPSDRMSALPLPAGPPAAPAAPMGAVAVAPTQMYPSTCPPMKEAWLPEPVQVAPYLRRLMGGAYTPAGGG